MKVSFVQEDNKDIITVDSPKSKVLREETASITEGGAESYTKHLIEVFKTLRSALGLASPQINKSFKAYIAKLHEMGTYVFINPDIKVLSNEKYASYEGCLSVPKMNRLLERNAHIEVGASIIYKVNDDWTFTPHESHTIECKGLNAAICQHEQDHINGVLICDYPKSWMEKVEERKNKRESKIKSRRAQRKSKVTPAQRMNPKRQAKLEKEWKRALKKEKIRVEIQERFNSEIAQFDPSIASK